MNIVYRYVWRGLLLTACLVGLGVGCARLAIMRIEHNERVSLLEQAQQASLLVAPDDIETLSGNESDLTKPAYLSLKEQFAKFRSYNKQIRFVYLMGYHPDLGVQFFYVDSEPETSEDYSPPGQIFADTRAQDIAGYLKGVPYTDGPYSDAWGEWMSSYVPIHDAAGAVIAMVGIDVATSVWREQTAFATGAIALSTLILCIVGLLLMVRLYKKDHSITMLKTQNLKLVQHAETLKEVQTMAQLGRLLVYFPDQTFVVDEQFVALFSTSANERISLDAFLAAVHPDDHPMVINALDEMSQPETTYTWFDARIGSVEYGYRKYHIYGNIERDQKHELQRFAGIMQDITDIQK